MVTYYLLLSDTLTPNGVLSAGYSSMKLLMGTVSLRNHCLLWLCVNSMSSFTIAKFRLDDQAISFFIALTCSWQVSAVSPSGISNISSMRLFFGCGSFFSPMSLLWFLAVDVSTPFCPVFLRFLNRFLNAVCQEP